MKYSAREPRSEVRNLAFAIWQERVQRGGSYLGMPGPIGSQPAISWACLQISYCNWSTLA